MSPTADPYRSAAAAATHLEQALGPHDAAVVLGSGWAEVGGSLGSTVDQLRLADLPGAVTPTVAGHEGGIHSIELTRSDGSTLRVLVVAGRSHLYEGHDASTVVHNVRALVLAGCRTVVLTNAAGSLQPQLGVGSAVLISDHLNLTGTDPMVGAAPTVGPPNRFVDLTDLYSARLRERIRAAVPDLPRAVYAGMRGGSFETPAEIRMLHTLGADLVGMSTVLEAIAAHHLGAAVVGISLVTNLAAGLQPAIEHDEVLAAGHRAASRLTAVLRTVLDVV